MSRTPRVGLLLVVALVLGLVGAAPGSTATGPSAAAAAARPRVTLDDLGARVLPGRRVFLTGYLDGPRDVRRVLLTQQRRDGRWVTVARERDRPGLLLLEVTTPRRLGPVSWRVVAPRVRVGGRVLARLTSATQTQRVVRQRLSWRLPRAAEVGTRVVSPARLLPAVDDDRLVLQQRVNGHWQQVAVADRGRPRFRFVLITSGLSRFRVRGSNGRYSVRTLRGTPTDTVLPTRRLSTTSNGSQTSGRGFFSGGSASDASASDDGRFVAFTSDAVDVVPGDTNGVADVFLKDTRTAQVRRISVGPRGRQADRASSAPAVSGDGRFVTFVSRATDLVPRDRNGRPDVFVRDRTTGTTTRVGLDASEPTLSRDGRFVAFTGGDDVLLRDRTTGALTRVSRTPDGGAGNGPSGSPAISGDGRYVLFGTRADDLTPSGSAGVVLWDRTTAENRLAAARARHPQVDADGSVIAYEQDGQVWRVELTTATKTQVSTGVGPDDSAPPTLDAISADGSAVLFSSAAPLVADDVDAEGCPSEGECYTYDNYTDAFVWRAGTGEVEMASRSATGEASDYYSVGQDLLADGSGAVFLSRSVLVPGQTDRGGYYSVHGYVEVFVRDLR